MNPGESPKDSSRFLEALFAGKPEDLFILIWTLRGEDKRSHWFQNVGRAVAYANSLRGCNVYVGIGLSPSDLGEFRRCESENAAGIVGFAADIDLHSEAHPKGARPTSIEQALSILPPEFPASIIVHTGNGIQCWWLFKEPWIFESDKERPSVIALSSRWQTLLKYNAQRHGWAFERLGDLARVLRVPGTQNMKDPAHPKDVIIRTLTEYRYNPAEFRDYLDDLSVPDEDERTRQAKTWAEQFGDKTLAIDFAGAIGDEQLARWMQQDNRFHQTWTHQRTDLQDTSQSGYDMALASFGVRNGLPDQQLVNLIIHNRRFHGAKQSKSLDYYRRTISKARNGASDQGTAYVPAASGPAPPNSDPANTDAPDHGSAAVDPNAKAKLCEQLSAILGVCILRIVKITGAEPSYLMELDSGPIEFSDTSKLLSYRFVRSALAGRAGKVIGKFKTSIWDQVAQIMIDACTEKEGTDDLELKGRGRMYIGQYLADHSILSSLKGQSQPLLLYPVIEEGRIAISSTHLQQYINKTTSQALSVKHVATMIAALGGEKVRVRCGRLDQERWALPLAEGDPKDYPSNATEDSHGE